MARPVSVLELTPNEKRELQRLAGSKTGSQRDGLRVRIVLRRAEGSREAAVAVALGVSINTVSTWSRRFEQQGLDGLRDRPGRGRKAWLPSAKVRQVITRVVQPPKGKKKWSTRSMAAAAGMSHQSVHRIWKNNDLKPHLLRTFKISQDPQLERKFWDVIGLYLNPPDKALVLCCDEKSQCQALERTQPGLPLGIGHVRTQTHDYKRHGTITLFAALNYLDGKILARTEEHHTPCGMVALPETDRARDAAGAGTAPDCRQLCDPQTPEGAAMAEAPSPRDRALHTDGKFVDESGGALFR